MSGLDSPYLKIPEIKEKLGLTAFCETGTHEGNGLRYATYAGFECYSCDINPEYCRLASLAYPKAFIFQEPSLRFLEAYCYHYAGRTLFWLDAHFPTNYGKLEGYAPYMFPLFDELKYIREHKMDIRHDVIMCDDTRNLADKKNPRYWPGEIAPEYYVPCDWEAFTHMFDGTHDFQHCHDSTGIGVFMPKGAGIDVSFTLDRRERGY